MNTIASSAQRGDGRLWAIALGLSLIVNTLILVLLGLASMSSQVFRKDRPLVSTPPPPAEQVITIFPETAPATQSTVAIPAAPEKPRFARTTADQSAPRPEKPKFIGERDTEVTSNRTPSATAPPMPSQAGIDPKNPDDFETTESDYRDGKLTSSLSPIAAPPLPPEAALDPANAEKSSSGEKTETPGKDDSKSTPPPRERLAEGPNPVDIAVPFDAPKSDIVKPTPPKMPKEGEKATQASDSPKPKPQPVFKDPAFSGFQRKTAITGSISRTGKSALAVADSPLGRYQAIISRAVEQEWQRNCVRHRDFITPGFLTVRFFVETSGRVRTVQFVGEMETGEVQKGFTLNSIRDAEIPAMPTALKKEYDKEPLELIFNFYF